MIEHYATIHVYREGAPKYWVAKNIELDIVTSHPDRDIAVRDIMRCTEAQLLYAANLKSGEPTDKA